MPLFLVITIFTALVTMIGCACGNEAVWGYYPGKYWSKAVCILLFIPVRVSGREHLQPNQSYVFVANHQGAFDIFLVYGYLNRPFKWLMKKSLRKLPFVGVACESAGHVFVDNSSPAKIKKTIAEAEKRLSNGVSVVVFPEGSRTSDGRLHGFKGGAFQLAVDLDLPIVPITIEGSYQVMKKGTLNIFPHPLRLTIHPPLKPDVGTENPTHCLKRYAYETIKKQLDGERNE